MPLIVPCSRQEIKGNHPVQASTATFDTLYCRWISLEEMYYGRSLCGTSPILPLAFS